MYNCTFVVNKRQQECKYGGKLLSIRHSNTISFSINGPDPNFDGRLRQKKKPSAAAVVERKKNYQTQVSATKILWRLIFGVDCSAWRNNTEHLWESTFCRGDITQSRYTRLHLHARTHSHAKWHSDRHEKPIYTHYSTHTNLDSHDSACTHTHTHTYDVSHGKSLYQKTVV